MKKHGQRPEGKGRLAIIAGRGALPLNIARAARAANDEPFIIGLKGEVFDISPEFDHAFAGVGDAATILGLLKEKNIGRVILSGAVNRRPEIADIRSPFRLLPLFPGIVRAVLSAGDDKLLRAVISVIEKAGCRVVGAQEIVPDLLAKTGPLSAKKPGKADIQNMEAACAGAIALGQLDVGQGAVAVGGRIVALEGAEGTDSMLERVAAMRKAGRISKTRKGVLVKLCKPQQDERVDLPSIGPDTIQNAYLANLSGVAVEAGRSFVLDREDVIERADRLGLFVWGIDRTQVNLPSGNGVDP